MRKVGIVGLTIGVLSSVALMSAVLLAACGPSTPQVESIVATAVAESERRITEEFEAKTVKTVSEALAGSEERMTEAIEESAAETVKALCTADYTKTVLHTTVYWLVDHLRGGETTLEDVSLVINSGIPVKPGYGEFSRVCDVDEDGRWIWKELPDEVN